MDVSKHWQLPLAKVPAAGGRWVPWVGLLLGLALTLGVWRSLADNQEARVQAYQRLQADATAERVERRMQSLVVVLRGATGFLSRGDLPTRAEWRVYVEGLDLPGSFAGTQGLGFAQWVPAGGLAGHERRLRADGFPDYRVVPGGVLPRDPTGDSSIIYLEPMDARNQRAFAKDMWADPVRREAMARARDLGQPSLSGPVTLYQETSADLQVGAVLYAPVYRFGQRAETVAQRRAALLGWCSFPLRMNDLMRATLAEKLPQGRLDLSDVTPGQAPRLLYASAPGEPSPSQSAHQRRTIEVAGRVWALGTWFRAADLTSMGRTARWEVLVLGILANVLFFMLFRALGVARAWARSSLEQEKATRIASEVQFQTLFDLTPDPVSLSDLDTGRLVQVNGAWCRATGLAREEALGRTSGELGAWPEPAGRDRLLDELRERGTIVPREVHLRQRDGSLRTVLVTAGVVVFNGGPCALIMGKDLTERVRAEAALRDREARYLALFDLAPDGISITRLRDSLLMEVNTGWEQMFGFTRAEAEGRTTLELGLYRDPEDRRTILADRLPEGGGVATYALELLRKDRTPVLVELHARVVDLGGEPCLVGALRDVTRETALARKAAEDEARAAKAESLVLMAGSIAHDFNNLFQALMTNLDLLGLQCRDLPEAGAHLGGAKQVLRRAITLSWKMLDFAGHAATRLEWRKLEELLAGWAPELDRLAGGTKLELDLGNVPRVKVDPANLAKVLAALVANAREAMEEAGVGEGKVRVRLFVAFGEDRAQGFWAAEPPPRPATVCLEVANDGPLPGPEVMLRMFDPFYTTKALGRGLGLPSALGLVKGQGAGLNVLTNEQGRLAFRIHFPPAEV